LVTWVLVSLVVATQVFASRPPFPTDTWQFEGRWRAGDLLLVVNPLARFPTTLTVGAGPAQPVSSRARSASGDRELRFRNPDVTIAVRMRPGGRALDAAIDRGGTLSTTVFVPEADAAAPKRPQTPRPPHPYDSYDLAIDTGSGVLQGTLTLPRGGGPFPAVVLFGGTGQEDRDGSAAGHRPFFVIADHLTRAGFATLRFDERGRGGSSGLLGELRTVDADALDALALVDVLRQQPEIDPARVGIVGHSEGGLVAVSAATLKNDVAFVVLLGSSALDGVALSLMQHESVQRSRGAPEAHLAFERDVRARVYEILKAEPDRERAREAIGAVLRDVTETAGDSMPWLFSFTLAIDMLAGPRYSAVLRQRLLFDPGPLMRQLRVPVLALFGDLDVQVPAVANAPLMRTAIAGSSPHSDVLILEGLNHAFQTARTGAVEEYARIEETIAPRALTQMTAWLRRVARK
jgi:dienelactone hydrolase